jgi:hypothetical protein
MSPKHVRARDLPALALLAGRLPRLDGGFIDRGLCAGMAAVAKGKEQMAKMAVTLIALLASGTAHAMAGQFGTYSQAYLDRQRYLVFAVTLDGQIWYNKADAIKLPVQKCEREARKYHDSEVTAACYREEEFRALPFATDTNP